MQRTKPITRAVLLSADETGLKNTNYLSSVSVNIAHAASELGVDPPIILKEIIKSVNL
jgi:hypothetical protein